MFDDLRPSTKPTLRQQMEAHQWRTSIHRMMLATTAMVFLMFCGYCYGAYHYIRFQIAMAEVSERMRLNDERMKVDMDRMAKDMERAFKAMGGKK